MIGFLNLERTGPLVIDYPKGQTAGGILDFWQRQITDMGLTGPDKGEGGQYLVLAPGQEAPRDAEGYRVCRVPHEQSLPRVRVLITDPKAAETLMSGYQAYPYAKRENPRKTRVIRAQGQKWSGWPEGAMEFWRLLAKMLDEEPVHERDRMMVAMIKPLGIEKGKPFRARCPPGEDPGAGRGGRGSHGPVPQLRQASAGSPDLPRHAMEERRPAGSRTRRPSTTPPSTSARPGSTKP